MPPKSSSGHPSCRSLAAHASPWRDRPWSGVYPATLCSFHEDESLDEEGIVASIEDVASVPGVEGVVCNGHTGEIMSLSPDERASVTRLVAEGAARANARTGRRVKVISGVSAEGSREAVDHAIAAREAGAEAILLMPPHHWLRFGRSTATAVGFIEDVAAGGGVSIIVHQYPAWTKAGYTLAEMQEMVRLPGGRSTTIPFTTCQPMTMRWPGSCSSRIAPADRRFFWRIATQAGCSSSPTVTI